MKEQPRICPLCGRAYDEPPALSRVDNQTDICPRCGMMEALAAMPRRETPQERTRRAVYATGNRWAIENFEATHHYQAVVNRSTLGDKAKLLDQEPIVLKPWDPMGSLAL